MYTVLDIIPTPKESSCLRGRVKWLVEEGSRLGGGGAGVTGSGGWITSPGGRQTVSITSLGVVRSTSKASCK